VVGAIAGEELISINHTLQ